MKWLIITCDKSDWICEVQRHLFAKYAPGQELVYFSTGSASIDKWCAAVLFGLASIKDEYIMFGLDDYLPIDHLKPFVPPVPYSQGVFNRLGIGWGDSKSKNVNDCGDYIGYTDKTQYSCSCQFAVWRTDALRSVLKKINGSPWDFEVKGELDNVYALKKPAFRWIEESALSQRKPGKINLLGMRETDIKEICDLGLVDRSKIIFGWKGSEQFTPDLPGPKYQEFYA